MDEWEARYKALKAGIDNPQYVENAEKLVRTSIAVSVSTALPFEMVMDAMLKAILVQQSKDGLKTS